MSRVLILGAGLSGMAAARLARSNGMVVTIYDQVETDGPLAEGFGSATGDWDPAILSGIDLVVASPGFSERSLPIVESLESGVPIWSEIELAWRSVTSPVAAVTGTNGKTSVTEATAAMLDASGLEAPATGNIGAPLSEFTETTYDALVVEVSSFQLRFIDEFHPIAAAITNVAVDHLDWHGSEQSYRQAKARIYENQTSSDLLVYDADDPGATALALAAPSELLPVSGVSEPDGGVGPSGGVLSVGDVVVELNEIPLSDPSHLANLSSAACLALRMGATADGVSRVAKTYTPGAHRRTVVLESGGITWVDDSKATNPHAAIASIRARGPVVLIAGGLAKGLDITPLASEPNVRMLIGVGKSGPEVVSAAGDRGRLAGTIEVAVEMAAQAAEPGDVVLLAPGCASFDQFDSYAARGDRFVELVEERVGGMGQ